MIQRILDTADDLLAAFPGHTLSEWELLDLAAKIVVVQETAAQYVVIKGLLEDIKRGIGNVGLTQKK